MGRLPADMGGQHEVPAVRSQLHGQLSRHGGDDAVDDHGQAVHRSAQEEAGKGRDIEAAQFGQDVQRVGGVRPVQLDGGADRLCLAGQAGVGQARPPAGQLRRGPIQQQTGYGGGGGGIADAHLAADQQVVALILQPARLLDAEADGFLRLLPAHGRTGGDISRAAGALMSGHAGLVLDHAHVEGENVRLQAAAQSVDIAVTGGHLPGHGGGDLRATLGHAPGHHAVVSAEDRHGPIVQAHVSRALDGGQPAQGFLQPSQRTQRLGQSVPAAAAFRGGPGVGGAYLPQILR